MDITRCFFAAAQPLQQRHAPSHGVQTALSRPLRLPRELAAPARAIEACDTPPEPAAAAASVSAAGGGGAGGDSSGDSSAACPPAASGIGSLPPERLKQLRREGMALKDVIKLGRRGAAEGLAKQVQQRWNTSEVARLYCHGKHAANMKLLVQQLEAVTGGSVVHRAGGTVLLYRGDHWQPAQQQEQAPPPPQQPHEAAAAPQPPGMASTG